MRVSLIKQRLERLRLAKVVEDDDDDREDAEKVADGQAGAPPNALQSVDEGAESKCFSFAYCCKSAIKLYEIVKSLKPRLPDAKERAVIKKVWSNLYVPAAMAAFLFGCSVMVAFSSSHEVADMRYGGLAVFLILSFTLLPSLDAFASDLP